MKNFKNYFFYCQYPRDFILAFCFCKILRKLKKKIYISNIITKDDYSKHYDWSSITKDYEKVYYIDKCNIGSIKNRINLRGLIFFLLFGYFRAFKTNHQFHQIKIPKNTLLITFGGFSLEKSLFLNLSNKNKNIETLLIADDLDDVKLSAFKYAIRESLYYNLYQFFYAKKYVDIFWFRSNVSTSQREYRFRNIPSDYFFKGEYILRNCSINSKQLYWPISFNNNKKNGKLEVVIIGGMYHWEKLINLELFYKTYNSIINLIRDNANNIQLTYINHPSTDKEKDNEIKKLDLEKFKIIRNLSCENYAYNNNNELIFFSVFSTAIYTLNQIGSKSYTVYKLFNKGEISQKFINRLDNRWRIDKKFGKYHLDSKKEILKAILNFSQNKISNSNNLLIKDYQKKLDFLS